MTQRRVLIPAIGLAILLIAVIAATPLFPDGPLSREKMRLVDGFVEVADSGNGISLGDCNDAKILKTQIEAAGLCIDYDNTRRNAYEDFYLCGRPR